MRNDEGVCERSARARRDEPWGITPGSSMGKTRQPFVTSGPHVKTYAAFSSAQLELEATIDLGNSLALLNVNACAEGP